MKNFITFLFFALAVVSNAQDVYWSSSQQVASNEFGDRGPKIVTNDNGEAVLMWGRSAGAEKDLYVSVRNNGEFTDPVSITADLSPLTSNIEGPTMKARGNTIAVTFQNSGNNFSGLYVVTSTDGGYTWNAPQQIFEESDTFSILPDVEIDENGRIIIAYIGSDDGFSNVRIECAVSNDGITFSDPIIVSTAAEGEEVCECCPVYVKSQGDHIYIFFRNNNSNLRDIWAVKSNSTLTEFTTVDIDESNWIINACPASGPVVILDDDSDFAVYKSSATGTSRVYISEINDDDFTLIENTLITGSEIETINQNHPQIAGNSDEFGVVWEQVDGGERDLFFSYSNSGMDGITQGFMNLGLNSDEDQRYPAMAYNNGSFHVVYQDSDTHLLQYMYSSDQPINIEESENTFSINIFPNPVDDFLQIEVIGSMNLEIYNSTGELMEKIQVNEGQNQINLSHLSKGFYFVKGLHFTKRIVKI